MEKEERCLYYYTHHKEEKSTGFGLRRFNCDECDGYKTDCRLYDGVEESGTGSLGDYLNL